MKFRHVFDHWTYETFPPGRLLRRRYNSFKKLMELEEECLGIIAEIENIGFGQIRTDWTHVEQISADLGLKARAMLEQLQEMNPVKFMDIMDYYNKINFYLRMSVTVPDPEISKPFTFALEDAPDYEAKSGAFAVNLARLKEQHVPVLDGMVLGTDIYNYFIEANNLRIAIDEILTSVDSTEMPCLKSASERIIDVFMKGIMPPVIANEVEIAALEASRGSGTLTLSAGVTPEDSTHPLPENRCTISQVQAQDIVEEWKKAALCKFTPASLKARIETGYSDRESPVAVLIQPTRGGNFDGTISTAYTTDTELPPKDKETGCSAIICSKIKGEILLSRREKQRILQKPDPSPLSSHSIKTIAALGRQAEEIFKAPLQCGWILDTRNRVMITSAFIHPPVEIKEQNRIKRALPFIAGLNISPRNTEMFLPEKSRSIYDLVRFANEKGIEEMFSLVSKKGLGLDGAKHLKARQPISLTVLNLADALFTTAAGKLDISPDDIESAPMWALWFGLGADRPGWTDQNAMEGYAILSKTYMNVTLKSEKDLIEVDAVSDQESSRNHIHFRFKGGSGTPEERMARIVFLRTALVPQGFEVSSRGDFIQAMHGPVRENEVQRLLATVGHVIGHIATHHPITENLDRVKEEAIRFITGLG
ncbi:PEP/pyruvate-binding domain-containing protein [Maridesulfovibrio sp.]|uniref:PEP/pyruvate-binding domain-containing protein n=1 Tax=Maridesulfovibrio sp. TaxID=2795000 RepID=UPI002A18D77D|nr:PEP/pyruvate-binding domain-containing protein [Maridesulfovibrio sp.]